MIRLAVPHLLLALAALAGPVLAQQPAFPNKVVTVVSPFAPGSTDTILRPFVEKMGEFLGQPVVLNYKPGAGGSVGAASVAASKPDGYTLVGTSIGSVVLGPLAEKDSKYNLDSFTPVVALAEGNLMLIVPGNSPHRTMKDLIEFSRKNPEKVTYGSSGAMGITHLLTEMLAKEAGVRWTHVPYQGSGPAITALLGGHVDAASTSAGSAQAHLKSGALRALAVYSDTRMKGYPEVGTLREHGYNVSSPVVYGLLAPAGTPREVVETLHQAVRKVVAKYGEPISANLAISGAEIKVMGPEEYGAYLRTQQKLYGEALRNLGAGK